MLCGSERAGVKLLMYETRHAHAHGHVAAKPRQAQGMTTGRACAPVGAGTGRRLGAAEAKVMATMTKARVLSDEVEATPAVARLHAHLCEAALGMASRQSDGAAGKGVWREQ